MIVVRGKDVFRVVGPDDRSKRENLGELIARKTHCGGLLEELVCEDGYGLRSVLVDCAGNEVVDPRCFERVKDFHFATGSNFTVCRELTNGGLCCVLDENMNVVHRTYKRLEADEDFCLWMERDLDALDENCIDVLNLDFSLICGSCRGVNRCRIFEKTIEDGCAALMVHRGLDRIGIMAPRGGGFYGRVGGAWEWVVELMEKEKVKYAMQLKRLGVFPSIYF